MKSFHNFLRVEFFWADKSFLTPFLFFLAINTTSIFFTNETIFRGNLLFLFLSAMIIFLNINRLFQDKRLFHPLLIYSFASPFFLALFWLDISVIFNYIYYVFALLSFLVLNEEQKIRIIDLLTYFFIILVGFSIIGFLFAFFGGKPITSFSDGHFPPIVHYLYLSTLSFDPEILSSPSNIIRASSIFNEPGNFSFLVCFIVGIRTLYGKNDWINHFLLIGCIHIFSIAHLIFLLCFYLSIKVARNWLLFGSLPFFLLLFYLNFSPLLIDTYAERLFSMHGPITYRYDLLINTLHSLDLTSFFFGLYPSLDEYVLHIDKYYPPGLGENPFTLIALGGGIIGSAAYYFSLATFFYKGYIDKSLTIPALGLLLLQRPQIFQYGFSLIIVFALFVTLDKLKQGKNKL